MGRTPVREPEPIDVRKKAQSETAFSADEFSAAVSALANAFGDPTRREIYLYLREQSEGGHTCSEVAEHFELHANVATVRSYLDAGRGRPSSRW